MTVQEAKPRSSAARMTGLVVAVLVGVAVVGFLAFYQTEVGVFFKLQGWNLGAVKEQTKQFVDAAAAGDGEKVASLLLSEDSVEYKALRTNGKLTGIKIPDYGGPVDRTLKAIAPNTKPEISEPELITLDDGMVKVEVTYPRSHKLQLRWVRPAGAWKVKSIGWTDQTVVR
jgi:hypothetical protein